MFLVLDTNVLVSALLSPSSPPARILAWVLSGKIMLCVDARILAEYEDVLHRPVLRLDAGLVDEVLEYIRRTAVPVQGVASPAAGPDPDDMAFVEVGLAGPAECLVTGNLKHYPPRLRATLKVIGPAEFVQTFARSPG